MCISAFLIDMYKLLVLFDITGKEQHTTTKGEVYNIFMYFIPEANFFFI